MDRPVLPDNLSALNSDALVALGADIRRYMKHLTSQALSSDVVDELEAVRGDYDAVEAAAAAKADEADQLAARAAAATAGVDEDDDDADGADDGDDGDDADPDRETQAAGDTDNPDDDEAGDDGADGDDDGDSGEDTRTQAAVRPGALRRLSQAQRTKPARRTTRATRQRDRHPKRLGLVAAKSIEGIQENTPFEDMHQFAEAVTAFRHRMGRMTMTGRQFEYLGRAGTVDHLASEEGFIPTVQADHVANFADLMRATNSRDLEATLVASGALCPPDNPFYDFFRLAEVLNPVEQALPTVATPRGSIRYIRTPDFRAARAAIGTRTAAENADSETPAKPCARVTCPTVLEASVTAVSECVLFDNLGYRAFPELVQNFMADVAVNFAAVKECLYLTDIDAGSTATTAAIPAYGAARAFFFQLRQASSAYRKRHNMRRNALLQGYFPSWLPDLLAIDMQNDHSLGLNSIQQVSDAMINQIFANLNVSPTWVNDQANCNANAALDLQAWRAAQTAGVLNAFPTTAVWYLHAPGTFARLDAGTLDVGLVRDSVLNGTNDLEIFMEQWVGTVKLGNESIKVTSTLCPSGEAPTAVAAMTCA